MLKFTRSWTMHMKTDKQGFKTAFTKVLKDGNGWFFYNALYTYEIWELCYGSVKSDSFSIVRQSRFTNWPQKRLEGKMIEDDNGLLLNLHMHPGINYFNWGIGAVVFSVVMCYLIVYLLFMPRLDDYFFLFMAFLFALVFASVCWLTIRITRSSVNVLQGEFVAVLHEIEKHLAA